MEEKMGKLAKKISEGFSGNENPERHKGKLRKKHDLNTCFFRYRNQ